MDRFNGHNPQAAVLAVVPLMRSCHISALWHAGEIAECGGLCTANSHSGRVTIRIGHDGIEVEPFELINGLTSNTVLAHVQYKI